MLLAAPFLVWDAGLYPHKTSISATAFCELEGDAPSSPGIAESRRALHDAQGGAITADRPTVREILFAENTLKRELQRLNQRTRGLLEFML